MSHAPVYAGAEESSAVNGSRSRRTVRRHYAESQAAARQHSPRPGIVKLTRKREQTSYFASI
jgi:hypothetical protein